MDHHDDNKIIKFPLNLEENSSNTNKKEEETNNNKINEDSNSNKTVQNTDKESNLEINVNNDSDKNNLAKSNNLVISTEIPQNINSISSQRNFPQIKLNPNSNKYSKPRTTSLVIIKNDFEEPINDQIQDNDHHDENSSHLPNKTATFRKPPQSGTITNQTPTNSSQKVQTAKSNSNSQKPINDDRNDIDTKRDPNLKGNGNTGFLNPHFQKVHDLDKGEEFYHLSGMSPLKTVCYLSIGPLINQISLAIESFVETIWVSKAIGKDGLSAVSSYSPFESITEAFGLTASYAGSCAVSAMIATNKTDKKEASQVIVDLLRVCLFVGILIPSILCPLCEKSVRWFGASENVANLGFKYIMPIFICTFSSCMFLALTGFIEGEGRPILLCLITVIVSISNVAFLCPLFLLGFKTGIVGAGIAKVLSRAIPCVILLVFYFKGAFTFKPKLNQVLKKFSPLTKGALKACLSQGVANLIAVIPSILIRKILGKISEKNGEKFDDIVSGFQVVNRYSQLFDRIVLGFAAGYLTVASFAYNKDDFKRWLFLTLHVNWICFAWCSFTVILTFSVPKKLASAFVKDKNYLKFAEPMIRNSNCGGFFNFVQYTVGHLLRSIKMGFMAAVIGTFVHVIGLCAFAFVLYYTNKKNPERLMYSYPLANLFGLLVGAAFIAYPCYKFYKEWKFKEENGLDNNYEK